MTRPKELETKNIVFEPKGTMLIPLFNHVFTDKEDTKTKEEQFGTADQEQNPKSEFFIYIYDSQLQTNMTVGTFLVVKTKTCRSSNWYLVGRDKKCCQTFSNGEGSPNNNENIHRVKVTHTDLPWQTHVSKDPKSYFLSVGDGFGPSLKALNNY